MNLVQIQEHLKGMPIQALMAYANGMNPGVPPYLALGELNRRKQVEQMAQKPEAPQGTVKDRIEGEAGLMALKKQAMDQMRLGAMNQQQMAQGHDQERAGREDDGGERAVDARATPRRQIERQHIAGQREIGRAHV